MLKVGGGLQARERAEVKPMDAAPGAPRIASTT